MGEELGSKIRIGSNGLLLHIVGDSDRDSLRFEKPNTLLLGSNLKYCIYF